MTTQQVEIYEEGYMAFINGDNKDSNPYERQSIMQLTWDLGWEDALGDLK